MTDLATFVKAIDFAARKHRFQRRKDADASPYINHPIAVANVLASEAAISDAITLCAALLHDTIEDTETTEAQLEEAFGPQITKIVLEVTDDKSLPKQVRKQLQIEHAPNLSLRAKIVKLADKICNLRDAATSPPVGWDIVRSREYFEWAKKVVDGIRGANPALEAIFDLTYAQGIADFDQQGRRGHGI